MELMKSIKEFLFPQEHICLFCKSNITSSKDCICTSCKGLIEFVNREIDLNLPSLEKIYYSVLYNRFIREKIHSFKFQGKSYLYKPFGEILLSTIKDKGIDKRVDAIIYVPIHRRKEAFRGYNQSQLLGDYVSKKLNIPILRNHLLKVKWTKDQNRLGKIERQNNLQNSFKTNNIEDFKGKEILLIDDIITTGATLEECSKSLMESGAKKIYGLALTSSMKL
ncbi:ComF family protein [Clostridium sp. Cult1]|jgi:ComF family protein|uniref:ComF family protein n=1 Tax=Clostridium sp. Cult1 TaxID=2079002 RepID=UPI001F47366E|nr:ComF family protein [Clostridium sp. Cult1]MCF6463964.1 hypothetical protein [Clostridium sp. Cult1]